MTTKTCSTCKHWEKVLPRPNVNWGTCELIRINFANRGNAHIHIDRGMADATLRTRDVFYCEMYEARQTQLANPTGS